MSYKSQFGTNVNAMKKRVRWYNRESSAETLYEGQPVCYMFDTTTNILGYDKGAGGHPESQSSPTTTAEGYQNEGKFLIVEKPYSDNLQWFAGVVAPGSWCNKSIAATSYEWIDIFIPNGAIVPVRTDVSSTVGRTVVALESDSQALTYPLSATQGRPVGICEETVDRTSTNGLCLVKLDPDLFLYQDNTGDALIAASTGTSDLVVNRINITSAQTSGLCCALWVQAAVTAGGTGGNGYGIAGYFEADVSGTPSTSQCPGVGVWMNLTGGTGTGKYYWPMEIGLYESGATLSGAANVAVLSLTSQVSSTVNSGHQTWMYLQNNGTAPDAVFYCNSIGDAPMTTASSVTTSHKIALVSAAGTVYYVAAGTATS